MLNGGDGADLFRYGAAAQGGDTIADFANGDLISIVKSGFGIAAGVGLGKAGALNFENEYFISGTDPVATKSGHGQFLFDTNSHELFWDSNGQAANGITLIATLTDVTDLSATDFELR